MATNYTGVDLDRYNAGNKFYSQDRYLQGTGLDKPDITFNPSRSNTGIMSAYQKPIIPMYDSGGDGGGGITNTPRSTQTLGMAGAQPNFMGGIEGMTQEQIDLMDESLKGYQPTFKDAFGFLGKTMNPFYGPMVGTGLSINSLRNKEKNFQEETAKEMKELAELEAARETIRNTTPPDTYEMGSADTISSDEEMSQGGRGSRMAYGGRAGYRDGGLTEYEVFKLGELGYNTKGGTVLEPFGGINVLKDILKVNKYAYGGIVGMYR